MTEEEKKAQMEQVNNNTAATNGMEDAKIFFPDGLPFSFGGKNYSIKPATMKQQKVILELSKMNPSSLSVEDVDKVIDCISILLKEPDKDFLENNLDSPTIYGLFKAISEANTMGIPQSGGNNGKGNGMRG